MKSTRFLLATSLLVGLSGCSKFFDKFSRAPEGFTNVRFSDGRRSLTAAMDGGMIVYALRQDGAHRAALHLAHAGDDKTFSLPNGERKRHRLEYGPGPVLPRKLLQLHANAYLEHVRRSRLLSSGSAVRIYLND